MIWGLNLVGLLSWSNDKLILYFDDKLSGFFGWYISSWILISVNSTIKIFYY